MGKKEKLKNQGKKFKESSNQNHEKNSKINNRKIVEKNTKIEKLKITLLVLKKKSREIFKELWTEFPQSTNKK